MNAHQRRTEDRKLGKRCRSCARRLTGESPCLPEHGGLCCDCVDEKHGGLRARLAPRLRQG